MSKPEFGALVGIISRFNSLSQTKIIPVASQAAMLALDAKVGDIVVRTDDNNFQYRLSALPANGLANWEVLGKDAPPIGETVLDIITTNEVITSKADGLYAFAGAPTGGFPAGVAQGDIASKAGSTWTVVYTFANAPSSIFSISDSKIYFKTVNGSGVSTWLPKSEPSIYEVGPDRQYTTLQGAVDAYQADFTSGRLASGVIFIYQTLINEDVIIGGTADIQNLHIEGYGTPSRANVQISRLTLGAFSHRVTTKNIQYTNTTNTPLTVLSAGTTTENGVANTPRGKHIFEGTAVSTNNAIALQVTSCDNWIIFDNCDLGGKLLNIANKTGLPSSVTISNCANAVLNVGNNRIVSKNNSLSVYRGTISTTGTVILDVDTATPIAYSILRSFTALGAPVPVALGTLIVNDDVSGSLQTLKCKTAYTIAGNVGLGTAIDLTKYDIETDASKQNIVRRNKVFTNQATNFTIPQADIDAFEAFEFNQTTAGIVIALSAPTANVKKDIYFKNVGTASINLVDSSNPIAAGKMSIASYNATSWNIVSGGGGGGSSGLVSYAITARPTTNFEPFYNSDLKVAEFYNGTFYQPTNNLIVDQVIGYAPFSPRVIATASRANARATITFAALPIAPTVGTNIVIDGITNASFTGLNGIRTITASTTTSVTFASAGATVGSTALTAGTLATGAGTLIQRGGTPAVGALKDIFYWSGAVATLAYSFANSPEVIQVGAGATATFWRKGNNNWFIDGSLPLLPVAPLSDSISALVYNNTTGLISAQATVVEFGAVLDSTITVPPANASIGDRYLIPEFGAQGAWAERQNNVAEWSGAAWLFTDPVFNASVTVTTGTQAGSVLIYSATTVSWVPAPNAALVVPQTSVTTPATVKGSLYQDATNNIIDAAVNTSTASPLSPVNILALSSITLTNANASGLYILQSPATLPALTTGSANIGYGDIFYWNSATLKAFRKYAYANAPAVIVVGTGTNIYTVAKFIGGWSSLGNSSSGSTMAGEITAWAGSVLPAGALWCDGASYNRTAYPALFARIGTAYGTASGTTFNVPDLRGVILRGVDGTAGRDPDKAARVALNAGGNTGNNVGSYQSDAFQGHWHNVYGDNAAGGLTSGLIRPGIFVNPTITSANTAREPINDGANGVPRTSNETRPKNVNVNYIIWINDQSASNAAEYKMFSSSAPPASGYLRQGTGPYSSATYPALATVMPGTTNAITNTGQGQAPLVAAKTGSNTMVVFNANNYGFTTNGGANWTTVIHSESVSYQGDANQNFAFFPTYGGNAVGVLVDLSNPATFVKRNLNDTLGYACTAAGASVFLVNSVGAGQRNIVQRSIDNFATRANITLPANFLSSDASGALIRGHYLTNTVIAVRDNTSSSIIARSTNAGDSAVANGAATFAQVNLPSAQIISAIATNGTGKWLLAPIAGSSGFVSNDDGVTWTQFTSPSPSESFYISGWDGLRWIMTSSNRTSFWYSTTGATGSWVNKSLSPYTIFGNSFRCNPARMTDNSLWIPTTAFHTLVNTNVTSNFFTVPAITEPTGSQLWVVAS